MFESQIGTKRKNVFAFILVVFFGFLFYVWDGQSQRKQEIRQVDRSGEILLRNDRSDSADLPFILSVKLISEDSNKLIFEIKYFMSDESEGRYSISIHPNMSDWAQSMNNLRSGINSEIISVSFRPSHPSNTQNESSILNVYINKYEGKVYKGKVFERTIDFPKTWIL